MSGNTSRVRQGKRTPEGVTPPAKRAIPIAIDLASKSHGEVTVVHVHCPLTA